MSKPIPSYDYSDLLRSIKERVAESRAKAAVSVNRELVVLYWQIGRDILFRQDREGWGSKIIDRLGEDLRRDSPGMEGFSGRNLRLMRNLAECYPDEQVVKQLVSLLPWGHNIRLMQMVKDPKEREWYTRACIEHGWSRSILEAQIEKRLIDRQGAALTNFARTLPAPQSDLAQQTLKDPYNLDFLTIGPDAHERHVEQNLVEHLSKFLVELGKGFAFVGRQIELRVGDETFFLDLLFYHVKLHCYVVIELKMTDFKPEYAGKLNFYLTATDDLVRDKLVDHPTIGILLCKSKDNTVVEYALRDIDKPIGVSQLELRDFLPAKLQDTLPTVEELQAELEMDAAQDA